jgi:hypothetical protein
LDISSYIGSSYTAPADGYVAMSATGSVATSYVHVINETTNLRNGESKANGIGASISVKKGDVISLTYTSCNNLSAKFIYAQGEVPN